MTFRQQEPVVSGVLHQPASGFHQPLLALLHPGYRPPRSWLLVLLVAGYGATVLSAAFGVHPGHSLWSDYERMQGVVDQAHWVVLAVVLASVLHTPRGWRAVLQANLAAGAAMACIVIARALDIGVPYFGALPESSPMPWCTTPLRAESLP